jgi:hypothetical protein
MPTVKPAKDRRRDARPRLKVKHLHRVDFTVVERVSELVFVKGHPVALLEWVDLGGVRIPLVACALEPSKLRTAARRGDVSHYDAVTVDPRFADAR